MTVKAEVTELSKRLREAAHLQDPIALATIQLFKLSVEEAKETLVAAEGDDMLRSQGAVRQLQRMHRELTTTPPSITKPE